MSEQVIPVLNEHQSHESLNTTAPSEYTPDAEEKKAIKLIQKNFEKAKNHRKQYDEKWLDYYKMFRGKQWKEQRPSYRHSEVINMVFQTIQSMVPTITDTRPRIEFIPQDPLDRPFAQILNDMVEHDWQKGNWLQILTEKVYDAHFYGIGYGYIGFDPEADFGLGSITYESKDPFYIYPDPNALDINKKCRYIIEAEPTDVEVLKRDYPDKAKFIKPDLIDLIHGNKTDLDQVKYKSPVDTQTIIEGTSAYEMGAKDQVLKITQYLMDDEFEEEKKIELEVTVNPETGEEIQVEKETYEQRLKYPNGRKMVMAGGVLLEDGPNPFEDGKYPYSRLVNYMLPREFYGISEVEQLESPQKIFNKLVSFTLDVLTLMGNPIWVVDHNADIDTDHLFNQPGLVVEKNPGSEVRRESGVQLQPYVLQMVDRMREWFDGVSGQTDVSRGVRPEGVSAASAITALQEATQTRIRLKNRNLDAMLQQEGQLYRSRLLQFYSSPRIARVTNQKTGVDKYFRISIEDNVQVDEQTGEEQTVKVASIQDYIKNPETGEVSLSDVQKHIIRGDFDVRVGSGSSLPFAKAEKFNKALKLYELGIIDREEVLKISDHPGHEVILERMKAKEEQEAQMAAAAQQQGGGQAPPPAA